MVTFESFQHDEVTGLKFGYALFSKPTLYTHIYHVDGLLIDTGQRKAQKRILNETKDLKVDQIFITHHHEDHSGNIEALQKQFSCDVFASTKCCELMQNPPSISFAQKMTWGDRPAYNKLQPVDGVIETGKYSFQLIPIPGHASDMKALYEPEQKWLFSADLYINSYIDYFLENESMAQQIASIKKILELDFDVMFCCHKPRLENGKQHLTTKLNFLESFFEEVSAHRAKGLSALEIFKSMRLKENHMVNFLSGGMLSKINMVRSVIRDMEEVSG